MIDTKEFQGPQLTQVVLGVFGDVDIPQIRHTKASRSACDSTKAKDAGYQHLLVELRMRYSHYDGRNQDEDPVRRQLGYEDEVAES